MNTLKEIKTTVVITLVLLIICCAIYPVFVFGAGQLLFPDKADGSLVYDAGGKPIASTLLGSTSSSGSNLGALSQTLHDNVKQRVADYRKANNLSDTQLVPADAVTASGSGLDPHISVKNALLQLPRVARARSMSEADVKALVEKCTDGPDFYILGDAGVNIVKLNLALDGKYK
jgi:K+-transporting ATPase ATPase C chain